MKKIIAAVLVVFLGVVITVAACSGTQNGTVHAIDPIPCNDCGATLHGTANIIDGAFYCDACAAKLAK